MPQISARLTPLILKEVAALITPDSIEGALKVCVMGEWAKFITADMTSYNAVESLKLGGTQEEVLRYWR